MVAGSGEGWAGNVMVGWPFGRNILQLASVLSITLQKSARKWVRGSCHAVCCAYKQHLRQQRTLANGTKAAEWGRAPKLGIWFANALKLP